MRHYTFNIDNWLYKKGFYYFYDVCCYLMFSIDILILYTYMSPIRFTFVQCYLDNRHAGSLAFPLHCERIQTAHHMV